MKIKNPTNNQLNVVIRGVQYYIKANGTLSGVPASDAVYWRDRLHNFLEIEEENDPKEELEKKIAELDSKIKETELKEQFAEEAVQESKGKVENNENTDEGKKETNKK